MEDAKRHKGPLLPSKSLNHRTHIEKAFVKDEVTFEISKKSSRSNGEVKQFDSSKIESPLLTPSVLEKKATAKKAAD